MPERDFRTAAEARAEERARRIATSEKAVERVKRAVEAALDVYGRGSRERGECLRYCARIGLEIQESAGAGLEFHIADWEAVGDKIAREPTPASLKKFAE